MTEKLTYTPEQAHEAILARINGVWDNEQLVRLGPLHTAATDDIVRILGATSYALTYRSVICTPEHGAQMAALVSAYERVLSIDDPSGDPMDMFDIMSRYSSSLITVDEAIDEFDEMALEAVSGAEEDEQ